MAGTAISRPAAPFAHADSVLRKLIEKAGDDESLGKLVQIALERLPYQQNESVAAQLLNSILFHDDLAKTLDGLL